ncbi:MAG: 7-cyano-7-deazaguanine synthase QueC [Candidatus Omnitrophica bacterium]|nr:7-cyano-7-deazaguanine synthase QueC [Candidatus Omnitrophota bacterium]
MDNKKKGIILLSGGLDSVTTLYYAKSRGYDLTALIFDYNQRHRKEVQAARRIAEINGIKYHLAKIDLSFTQSSLTNRDIKVGLNRDLKSKEIPLTYVSGRNIIFLSYAFSLAESIKAKKIFIGAHIHDYSGYPDCRPEFLFAFNQAVSLGLKNKRIKIVVPLIDKDKRSIIKLGLSLGVPFEDTWSCYRGQRVPCLECDSCRFRVEAFAELGMLDPALVKKKK